ncbi:hypothetical protein WR25_25501 isoform C [Diploscapter pachys]|uniref:Uncharacterized protein n=1 Tax=Diploscapter pachys TaxID=2018661 RepID=A0A2A2LDK0_9BILA|nr:hypothetical protein WR25_25501 isoform B [Diploscapter pachys]PAV84225.1 hypothetical protein WR25_25501 isoform C [Diploscapter pachys]
MDKLFDLMTMTVKYQILSIVMAEQVFTVTINHLVGIRDLLPNDTEVHEQIEHAYTMSARVKVSLMLREKKQLDNGQFVILPPNEPVILPKDCNPPGKTSYFENDEVTHSSNWSTDYEYISVDYDKPDILDSTERSTPLGGNMYKEGASLQIKGGGGTSKMEDEKRGDELKLLENLFGNLTTAAKGAMDLSLFDDLDEEKKYIKETEKALGNIMKIDASKNRKTVSSAADEVGTL